MLLEGKNAIIHGGAGGIGAAVARAFAGAGATVHMTGRTGTRLDAVAESIRAAGGRAETTVLDALREDEVDAHADAVAKEHGSVDVVFNLISHGEEFGTPIVEMSLAGFEAPILSRLRSTFLTTRAAARHMIPQRSGVILTFGGYGPPTPMLAGMQTAFGAIESLRRSLAVELGPYGIRVITLQTGGVPEALPDSMPAELRGTIGTDAAGKTMLGRAATLEDVGNTAVFAASDHARAITAGILNITCGSHPD